MPAWLRRAAPAEKLLETGAVLLFGEAGLVGEAPEFILGFGELIPLDGRGAAMLVEPQQKELAHVGDQDLPVGLQVAEEPAGIRRSFRHCLWAV